MASMAESSPDPDKCVKDTTCKLNRYDQEESAKRDAYGTTNRYEIPESSEGPLLEFDDVLKSVGEFGSWQKALFFLTCTFVIIPSAFQITSVIFVSGTPKFQCTTPEITCDVDKCCKNCTKYEFIQNYTTISTEYNLICDRAYIAANVDAGFMAGMLVGSFLFGFVSDAFGRRFCMLICSVLMTAFGLGSVYTQSLVLFAFLRFATALSMMGFYVVQYVYILEIVGRDYRTMVGFCAFIFWLPGEDGVVLIAYYIREWRRLLLVLSCPPVLFIFLYLIVPESPRWLVLQGHVKAACKVLMKLSSNKRSTLTDPDLLRSQLESLHRSETNPHAQSRNVNHSPLDLLRTPRMRKRTLIFWFNWLVTAVVVFGFMFYITDLPGNFYLNMAAMYIGDVPGVLIMWITVQKFGRRIPNFVCMIVGGVFCLIVLAVPANQKRVSTVLALFGRFFVNCSFNLLFLYSSELYPTSIRNLALGSCSTLARVGSIAAPYVVMLSQLPGLPVTFPMLIYGVLAITAGFLTLWLPESLDSNMCQTTEEVNQAEEYYGFIWMGKRALNPFRCLRKTAVRALYLCVGFGLIFGSVKLSSPLTDYALHFPTKGVSDYVNIWGMPSLTQFTVCLWMKKNGTSSYSRMFFYDSYGAPGLRTLIKIGYGSLGFPSLEIGKSSISGWQVLLVDGKWHHLCLSWENIRGHLKIYKDGTLFGQHSAFQTGEVIKSGGSLTLANKLDGRNDFDGMLTNVNVWDHVLSPAEIEKMSKSCLSGEGNVYKWSDFIHGLKGETRVVIPSPCKPMAS